MGSRISNLKINYKSLTGSFLLAAFLWLAIKTDNEYTATIEVPIEISTLSENIVLKKMPPKMAKIVVKGSAKSLFALNFQDQKMGLSFPEINKDQVINLMNYKNSFQLPQDLDIEIIDILSPKFINLEVDSYFEAMVPVKINHEIKTSAGYLLVDYLPEVDSAFVKGPRSIVSKMAYVETNTVSASDVNLPFTETADLINLHKDVVTISPMQVAVEFNIEQLVERTIYNVPIKIIGVPNHIRAEATPTTISVRIKGGESLVSAITRDDIDVIFNYATSFESGKTNYPMQIRTPDKISWVEASPQSFNIKLLRKESNI